MTTPRDIIKASLRKLRAVAAGETPKAEEYSDGLEALNQMIASFSAEKIYIFAVTMESFNLAAGTGSYTIGSGGDFDTVRPKEITGAFIRDSGGLDYPVKPRPMDEYRKIPDKSAAGRPRRLFYNPTAPLGTIYTYPVADAVEALWLFSLKAIADALTQTETLTLPPEYEEFLVYNLAIRIAPEYGREVPPAVAAVAGQTMDAIMNMNAVANVANVSLDLPGVMVGVESYDITEG
jgi:hypothetical protein